jgi:hypothetical protein
MRTSKQGSQITRDLLETVFLRRGAMCRTPGGEGPAGRGAASRRGIAPQRGAVPQCYGAVPRGTGKPKARCTRCNSALRRLQYGSHRDPTGSGGGAKNRKFRIPRGHERSPDSGSARREFSNGGVVSKLDPQKRDFVRVSCSGVVFGRQYLK